MCDLSGSRLRPCKMKKPLLCYKFQSAKKSTINKRGLVKSKNIILEASEKELSSHTGIFFFDELWQKFNLDKRLRRLLPKKQRKRGLTQLDKFKALLLSFAIGNDCLDDLEQLRGDSLFKEILGGELPARTAGDFLANFQKRHIQMIQNLLIEVTMQMRLMITKEKKFILSMDSTPHKQCGRKMEGVAENYKGIKGFDSQNAYDQFGFSYLFDLRPGNTWTGTDAESWIYKIFSKVPSVMERWFRADSGYGSNAVFEALELAKVKFTIVLKDNVGRSVRRKNQGFLHWKKTNIEFFGSDECEISMGLYPIDKLPHLGNLRVVFLRKKLDDSEIKKQMELLKKYNPEEDDYRHYSIVTNIDISEMDNVQIIDFYRGRANCENYIKEQKHNFDFLHFPCKRFQANQAWGLIGTFAHNMIRTLSFTMDQKIKRVRDKKDNIVKTVTQLGYFAKSVRNKIINVPCHVVRSARRIKLKMKSKQKEVLEKLMTKIKLMFSLVTVFT